MDTFVGTVHSVRMPIVFDRYALKSKERALFVLAYLKQSIVEVKAEENCLAHAIIIAISRLEKDPNYNSYRRWCRIGPVVQKLLETTGIDLSTGGGGGIPELDSANTLRSTR